MTALSIFGLSLFFWAFRLLWSLGQPVACHLRGQPITGTHVRFRRQGPVLCRLTGWFSRLTRLSLLLSGTAHFLPSSSITTEGKGTWRTNQRKYSFSSKLAPAVAMESFCCYQLPFLYLGGPREHLSLGFPILS